MKVTSMNYAREILNNINEKNIIILPREKNLLFLKKYNIKTSDVISIVLSLTEHHFKERIINNDFKIKTKYLYVFKPLIRLPDEYGEILDYVYIKICEIKDGILVVSIHEDE